MNKNSKKCSMLLGVALTASLAMTPTVANAAELDSNSNGVVVTNEHKKTTSPEVLFNELKGLKDFNTKTTSDIVVYQGNLYIAYGQPYGPKGTVDLYSYNIQAKEANFEVSVPSESIEVINVVNGSLYVPNSYSTSGSSFTSNLNGNWENNVVGANLVTNHDVVSSNGSDLFVSGTTINPVSGQQEAAVWYSPDGVNGWEKVKTGGEGASYYWLEAYEGKVYASASGSSAPVVSVWSAGEWSDVSYADLGLSTEVYVSEADQVATFKGHLVVNLYNPEYAGGNVGILLINLETMKVVDTSSTTTTDSSTIYQFVDIDIAGDVLYGMSEDGNIYATSDGINWVLETQGSVFSSVTSFTVDPVTGIAYVVGADEGAEAQVKSLNLISTFENNKAPVINLPETIELNVGDNWMPFDNVTVTDPEEGDITGKLRADGNVNLNRAGIYTQNYTVMDSNGYQTRATISVTVKDVEKPNSVPVITAPPGVILNQGDTFNVKELFSASDAEDGSLTDRVVVTGDVDTSVPGDYKVTLTVTDSAGAVVSHDILVTILEVVVEVPNSAPVITLKTDKVTVNQGEAFDPLAFVDSASDAEDGKLIPTVTGDVNTNNVGERTITYTVIDSEGVETVQTLTLVVVEQPNAAPVITAQDLTIKKNSKFNPLNYVSASDVEDGNITKDVKVKSNTVNVKKNGTYKVVYVVTDSDGSTTEKAIKVTVKNGNGLFDWFSEFINLLIGILFR